MESSADRYYQPSGAVPLSGTILMQLLGGAAAFLLGGLYAVVNHYVPNIWLRGFAVLIFGAGVGFAVRLGAKFGKVRNRGFITLLGVAIGLVAVYAAWVFYIHLSFGRLIWIWSPDDILTTMKAFADTGLWSLGSWTPTGWALYAFWIAEAAAVVLLSVAVASSNDTPYCDYCNQWTKKQKDVASFALADPAALQVELEEERYEILDTLHAKPIHPKNCLKATVHSCPQCENSDFLTIAHAQLTVDGDGNETTNETELIKHLRVPRDLTEHLHELGSAPEPAPAAEEPAEVPATEAPAPEDEMKF